MGRIIKAAVVGLGRIGRYHVIEMGNMKGKFEIAAVCDHDPERLKDLPEQAGQAKRYSSLDEVLKDPAVEMVTLAVRHPDHVPMALKVMESGRIAVVEKPVATSVAEMDLLGESLKKHPGKLFFRHNRRFEPAFRKIREIAGSGILGNVQYIKLYRHVACCRRNDWMTMPEFYGGLLTNWGPHLIDQALQLLDSPVKSLWADVRRVISIGAGDDLFKILLTGTNGRLADVEVAGCNPVPCREMEIIGDRGCVIFENGELKARYIDPSIVLKDLKPHPENPPLEYGNFDEKLYFVESKYELPAEDVTIWSAIYDDAACHIPCPVTFEQAREVVRVTEEAFRFCRFEPIRVFRSKVLPE